MRNRKLLVIALILGMTAIAFVAISRQGSAQTSGKEKAASCCVMDAKACCMMQGKSGAATAAHESCDKGKAMNCCHAKPDCCKPGADCCKAEAECCQAGAASSVHHGMSAAKSGKACDMNMAGKECCATSEGCATKTAQQ
ncbi:MAG: hypothetical protein QOJ64_842 [Acidobacteriota bacterium]|nr:hypothetical protein [Acidobacteriota bacterium]